MLGVQLYLWLHLHELGKKLRVNDPGWDVAWIGMYSSKYSRSAMMLTVVVLPMLAAVALGVRGLLAGQFRSASWCTLILGSLMSISIGVLTFSRLPHSRVDRQSVAPATDGPN